MNKIHLTTPLTTQDSAEAKAGQEWVKNNQSIKIGTKTVAGVLSEVKKHIVGELNLAEKPGKLPNAQTDAIIAKIQSDQFARKYIQKQLKHETQRNKTNVLEALGMYYEIRTYLGMVAYMAKSLETHKKQCIRIKDAFPDATKVPASKGDFQTWKQELEKEKTTHEDSYQRLPDVGKLRLQTEYQEWLHESDLSGITGSGLNIATEEATATTAVENAERTPTQPLHDAAETLVRGLPPASTIVKPDLTARLAAVQKAIDDARNLAAQETAAEDSVSNAETLKTQVSHDDAKRLVDALPTASTKKTGLERRLTTVQNDINNAAAAALLATEESAATTAVEDAERTPTQGLYDIAEPLVTGLPAASTAVKPDLTTRLTAVESQINKRKTDILDIDMDAVVTCTKGEKVEIEYRKGVKGIKINSNIGQLGNMEAGNKKIRIPQNLPIGQHEIEIYLEDPIDPANNRTEQVTINITAQAVLNYPCNLSKKEMYVGEDLYMDLKPPVGTKAVIEYEESTGNWTEYQMVDAQRQGYSSNTKIDIAELANIGKHNFRTYLVDAATLVPIPKGHKTYATTKTVEVKAKPLDGIDRITISQQLDCFEGDTSLPLRLSHTPAGGTIKVVDELGIATITSTPGTTTTGTTNIRITGIDTTTPGEQYIIVTVEDPVPPNHQKEERVKVTVKPKKMTLKGILPDFGATTLPSIHKGNPVKLPALATAGIFNAQAIISGPGIPVDTKISINTGDTIDVPGLDTNTSGTKQIRITLIDPNYPNEKSNTATLSVTVGEAYSRPNLTLPEWTLGDSKKPEAKLELLAPNARVRVTYPNHTGTGGIDTKDMNTGTGGSLSTVLDRFNPRDTTDKTIRVEYIDTLGAPIAGTEVEIQASLKPKTALTRPEGLPAQVALGGHDQKITLKLKPGQTAILDDGHGHPIAGLPTGQPDEYSFAIPYAHPHRHRYENTPSTYNIRISDAAGVTLTPDFPVRVTDEIPPIKGTLAHSALSSIKNSVKNGTKNGTLDIHDYRSPHDGTRLRPGCISWYKETAWKGPLAKYKATIDGPHGTITVKGAKTPEELVKNIKHDLDHLYEHEMLEYCNVFNKPVPEALKHHDDHSEKDGAKPGEDKPKDGAHGTGHAAGEEHESKIKAGLKKVLPYAITGAVVGGGALAIGANMAGLSLMAGPIGWSAAIVGAAGYGVYKYIWGKKKDGGDDHGHGH